MAYAFLGSGNAGASATGTSLTVSATYTAGDHVFVWATRSAPGTTETITDGTNTYTQIGSNLIASSGDALTVYECKSVASGTVTLTQTLGTTSPFRSLAFVRYSGLTTSINAIQVGLDQPSQALGTDSVTSGNLTPGSQPGVLIGFGWAQNNAGTLVAGTGFTLRATFTNVDTANGSHSLTEDKRLTATTAVAATFTNGTTVDNYATIAIFSPEAAPAAANPIRVTFGFI